MNTIAVETGSQAGVGALRKPVALAAVVTHAVVEEFKIARYSFELFHGSGFIWHVRCCKKAKAALSGDPFIKCTVFTEGHQRRLDTNEPAFNGIVAQKMHALDDAWAGNSYDAVILLDADIVVTAPFVEDLLAREGDVILTPHHWHPARRDDTLKFGFFNSGFLFTRNRLFHHWWHKAFISQPSKFTDQQCLDDAPNNFSVQTLGEEANVGFWRAENGTTHLNSFQIPKNCTFLHAHLYQPSDSPERFISRVFAEQYMAFTSNREITLCPFNRYQLQVKAFALCCLSFLQSSEVLRHKELFREILAGDKLGLYSAILEPLPSAR